MHVPKRMAIHGLNISMAVFTGLSAYGILLYYEGGADAAKATTLLTTVCFIAGTVACIAGIGFFGVQLDRRKSEERREEEARKTAEAARKGRRKPARPS
ncbi:MAG TPA: hypothetical protein DDX05_00795 [Deltaproteobacteria bacterium]|nr:MAG: hypothetical protein A2Z26_00630 [Deltaproteobacteria bacterium RBG_16_66_15]HAM34243.1 hypothetical protein [Deltaproteobacteria bacterium]HBG72181.1 hypothetical protein [Deltaproteobacteria bacterium]